MPIYEYRCERCQQLSEFFLRVSDPHPESCPRCGEAGSLRKQISQTSFALKGEGWYVTDYKKAGPAKEEAKPAEGAPAGAADGKPAGGNGAATAPAASASAPATGTSPGGASGTASSGKDSTPAASSSTSTARPSGD